MTVDGFQDDKAVRFLKATCEEELSNDPLIWWDFYKHNFPTVAALARNIPALQSSSISCESTLPHARNLVSENHAMLWGDVLSACMCVPSWRTLVM